MLRAFYMLDHCAFYRLLSLAPRPGLPALSRKRRNIFLSLGHLLTPGPNSYLIKLCVATRIALLQHFPGPIIFTVISQLTFVQIRKRYSLGYYRTALFRGTSNGHSFPCTYKSSHSHLLTTSTLNRQGTHARSVPIPLGHVFQTR